MSKYYFVSIYINKHKQLDKGEIEHFEEQIS